MPVNFNSGRVHLHRIVLYPFDRNERLAGRYDALIWETIASSQTLRS
ncbi:MAG: hypothetical protein MI923_23560 [Phycisphaerales bacterium]|nr:hypothetical protein [Phycisphaerales bacterium]